MIAFLTKKKEALKRGEMIAYATGSFGEQIIAYFVGSFIFFYLTDYAIIAPVTAGLILSIPRIWDAINDPAMGIIADRTRTRFGRFRPYLLYAPIIIFISTVALYFIPSTASNTVKVTWALVAYIIYGMAYTALAIPNISLISVITPNVEKRAKLISMSKFAAMIGGGVPMIIVPIMIIELKGYQNVFGILAIIFCTISSLALLTSFVFTRERIEPPKLKQKPSIKKNFQILLKNKGLLILTLMGVVSTLIIWISSSVRIYFLKYNLGNEGLLTYFTFGLLPFNVLGLFLGPKIIKKYGSYKSFGIACIAQVMFSLSFFLIGNQSIISAIIWMGLIDVSLAIEGISLTNLIIDCVDYSELKTGERTEGLFFSITSFSSKVAGSLSSVITGLALAIVGFVPNVQQSARTLNAIFLVFAVMPAVSAIVSLILLKFFPLRNNVMKKVREELSLRKGQNEEAKASE